jgi:Fic family protein
MITKGEAAVNSKIAAGWVPRESTRQHILRVMRETGKPVTAKQLEIDTGCNYSTITYTLFYLAAQGIVRKPERTWELL